MKTLTILMIGFFLIMSAMPVFAAAKAKTSASETIPQESIFQKASDDINSICADTPNKTEETVEVFQDSYDNIAEGAPGAQELSLREHKSELAKRRRGTPNILVPGVF